MLSEGRSGTDLRPERRRIIVDKLSLSSGTIHYEAVGDGPFVVMLHGLSGSGRWWRHNVKVLSKRFRVHTVDLVGFGRSRGQVFKLDRAGQAVIEWMDALGIEQAHLIGHSMGGYVSIELASLHPQRVRRLVLVDALVLPMNQPYIRTAVNLVHAVRYMPFNFLPVLVSDALRAGPATLMQAGLEILSADIRPELHRIYAPTLIIWGEKDTLLPPALGKLINRHLINSQLYLVSGAGHNPMWDRPHEFNQVVEKFLSAGSHPDQVENPL